jgi:MoaA/NifB/PqqE/SkfB family radical SAM enzyme
MSRAEAFSFLDHVAALDPPALLLSGGEPLAHPDFFEYVARASSLGLRVSLSTNGTLIDARAAEFLMEKGVGYVGVSLDGGRDLNDAFRGVGGAFDQAMDGIRALKNSGCRVGLRFTMARPLLRGLPEIMRASENLTVDRVCFYHFIPSGRGRDGMGLVPSRAEMRDVLRGLFEWVDRNDGTPGEVLTVGNFSDGILLCLRLRERGDARAENALSLIARSGGGRSGRGIVSVRWDGVLFADQFSWHRPLGRWPDIGKISEPEMPTLDFGGRCGRCRWLPLCRGNMRARAEALTGDPRGEDPGCVLEDAEIEDAWIKRSPDRPGFQRVYNPLAEPEAAPQSLYQCSLKPL